MKKYLKPAIRIILTVGLWLLCIYSFMIAIGSGVCVVLRIMVKFFELLTSTTAPPLPGFTDDLHNTILYALAGTGLYNLVKIIHKKLI